ncbi:hypothetical protein JOF56_011014 [Kibdelosporangium banguiense]|uniref:Zinc-finger domain-containing protein n=1 Tax=Kibdelosporangium banguiense TaxID=1365924 RepID=A0ABS4U1T8_9PSEU|nr:hypothetical protein [Kibdelosporangium banguiense]MBP2330629.1 hypothetical protein [Kibdelosporangium banguiense]
MSEITHEATRRFWSGTWDTLCGLTIPADSATRLWLASRASCPQCQAARKAGKRL